MNRNIALSLLAAALIAPEALPQAPGAHWSVTPATGTIPSQRRENPGAASATHMYVFGGRTLNSGGTVQNALYEFDGATWTEKTAHGATGSPPARDRAGVTWDSSRNKLVVFGGDDGTGMGLNDIWEWDPVTNAWADVTPAGTKPSGRRWCSIAHDPNTGAILLFGGLDNSGVHLNDTWIFSGGVAWMQISNPTPQPDGRRQHHLVERPDFGDVILCAGQDATLTAPAKWRTDVWTWNGTDWNQIVTTTQAAAVVSNDAAYDPLRKRIVLVGGNGINGGSPTGEISEFDCLTNEWVIRWARLAGDPVVNRISRYFMAYVPALGKMYKISGQVPHGGASPTTTCEYQSDAVADFTVGSPGCASPAGMVTLSATQMPWIGRDFVMEVENAPAGSSTFFLMGINTTSIPLSAIGLGSASCVLTVDPFFTGAMAIGPMGRPMVSLPVPWAPSVVSAPPIHLQAIVLGPGVAWMSNRGDAKLGAL